jgi:hypothetical protein
MARLTIAANHFASQRPTFLQIIGEELPILFVSGALDGRRIRPILSFPLPRKRGTIVAPFFFPKFLGGEVE